MSESDLRKKAIVVLRENGFTWLSIGKLFGITDTRVQQIYAQEKKPHNTFWGS